MVVAVLALPHRSQLFMAVLSTPVSMCYILSIRGGKVDVGDVRLQIQVIDGLKPLVILTGNNVGMYGG